jgi:Na+-transporting NADH:ubiquinone oxidoreductase subunit A
MTTSHRIRRGFDIRIAGAAERRVADAPEPKVAGLEPAELPGSKWKAVVEEGQDVQTGELLVVDKNDREVHLRSPATGRVSRIVFGERRLPLRVDVTLAGSERFLELQRPDPERLESVARDEVVLLLKRSGLWPLVRQRPLGRMVRGTAAPSAIYVNGMDSEPLAADPAFAVAGLGTELQLAVRLLARLTDGKVYLTVRAGAPLPAEFAGLFGVEVHEFAGPHPAGLVGTHIAQIAPLRPGQAAWYLKAPEAARIGQWLRSGRFPSRRTIALAGSRAPARHYLRVREGLQLLTLNGGAPFDPGLRVINGTVLTGTTAAADGCLGFHAQTVTVIPEGGDRRDLFGWARPQFGKHSASRSVLSWLVPRREYELDARLLGGRRPLVNIGAWEQMTPLDILPSYLVRAIECNDLEEALRLGLLEVTEEDVALCTFADPCKIEIGQIVRKGLDLYEAEG